MSITSNGAISIEQTIGKLQLKRNCTMLKLIKDMNQKIESVFLSFSYYQLLNLQSSCFDPIKSFVKRLPVQTVILSLVA